MRKNQNEYRSRKWNAIKWLHIRHEELLVFKPFFQPAVIIRNTFIAAVIGEQAKRQAVGFPVLDYTSTAFFVIATGRFRTSALFYIRTTHFIIPFIRNIHYHYHHWNSRKSALYP